MRLRARLPVLQTSAKTAGKQITSFIFLCSSILIGGLGAGLMTNWSYMTSRPLVVILWMSLLGISLASCAWGFQTLQKATVSQSTFSPGNQDEYEAAFLRSLDATVILDDDSRCLRANPAAAVLFGVCSVVAGKG